MFTKNKVIAIFVVLLLCQNTNLSSAVSTKSKYPDYAKEYLREDKFENFNRKVFIFNLKLNKYVLRPVHIVWVSIMPKYGIEKLQNAATNIEYPRRVISSLIQKDFKASKTETLRFLTNTTLGIGGLFDPAEKYFKIEPVREDMEQALAKLKVKQGPYLVIPVLNSSSPRDVAGRLLDTALDPSVYAGSPIVGLVKMGLLLNKTSYIQPVSKVLESTYADPYDIAKKFYGIENYIKNANLDRREVLEAIKNTKSEVEINDTAQKEVYTPLEDINPGLKADLEFAGYNPQGPVTDSLRTALFELPGVNESIWSEMSVWNKCFSKQIKTASVNVVPGRDNYKYKYILQKDKNAPVVILYPSTGEGAGAHHSAVFAKLFYEEGYSIIIMGSNFHWEFAKSMPADYRPGIPTNDADHLRLTTSKILDSVQSKHDCQFSGKVIVGTSFGALTALFVAEKESRDNTMNITKYISLSPPIDALYALDQLDKNNEEWNKVSSDIKHSTAITAAKVAQLAKIKKPYTDEKGIIDSAAFSEDEAKIIAGFTMRQKLSDLVFTIENAPKSRKSDIYQMINNMSYRDYMEKYFTKDKGWQLEDMNHNESLYSITEYLQNNNNYKIYQSLDDYFVNPQQLKQLKECSNDKAVLLGNGAHLGYLYRKEFQDALRKDVLIKRENHL